MVINCHFFQDDEIEFDLDPCEVTDATKAEALAVFMRALGDTTGRVVVLTGDNTKDQIIAQYSSEAGEVIWTAKRVRPQPVPLDVQKS
jgi:hypothetical protein